MKTDVHLWYYLAEFFLEWEMFHTEVVQKIEKHISCSIFFFLNSATYEIMWNKKQYSRKDHNDNMAHAHCMPDT